MDDLLGRRPFIILVETPFSGRDRDRFGIPTLHAEGFDIEVWDLTASLFPQVARRADMDEGLELSKYRRFLSLSELTAGFRELPPDAIVLSNVSYRWPAIPVYRALSRLRIRYGVLRINMLPIPPPAASLAASWFVRLWRAKKTLRTALARRIPLSWLGIDPASFVVAGGVEYPPHPLIGPGTRVLWTHTMDFDLYLAHRNAAVVPSQRAGTVFLDEYPAHSPDYLVLGLKPYCTPEEYYPRLRPLFDAIEARQGTRVTIAAHPKSRYEDLPDYYGGRKIIRGKTCELVRDAGLVVAHCSTSINFAVLFRKPVLFVTTHCLDRSPESPFIERMAALLGKRVMNLDRPWSIDWDRELSVDEAAYARYETAYIKRPGSPEMPLWKIVADELGPSQIARPP